MPELTPRHLAAALALIGAAVLWAPAAEAHGLHYPKRNELTLRPDGVELVVRYAIHDLHDSEDIRDRFDRNNDGALDSGELEGLEAWMSRTAMRPLTIEVDGELLDLTQRRGSTFGIGNDSETSEHLGIRLELYAPLSATPRRLVFRDHLGSGQKRVSLTVRVESLNVEQVNTGTIETGRDATRVRGILLEHEPFVLELGP